MQSETAMRKDTWHISNTVCEPDIDSLKSQHIKVEARSKKEMDMIISHVTSRSQKRPKISFSVKSAVASK